MSTYIREHGAQRIHDNGWWERSRKYTEGQFWDPDKRVEFLLLFVGVGVGIWVLGEVEGQNFADHTVPLLKEERNIKRELRKVYTAWNQGLKLRKGQAMVLSGYGKGFIPMCLLSLPTSKLSSVFTAWLKIQGRAPRSLHGCSGPDYLHSSTLPLLLSLPALES